MPTVKEILKATGLTDDQIAALDAKALNAFDGVLTTAENENKSATAAKAKAEADFKAAQEAQTKAEAEYKAAVAAKEQAELVGRSNVEYYEQTIVPGLTGWDAEKTRLENERVKAQAEAAYYRTQNEGARAGGFIPNDAPGYVVPVDDPTKRDGNGRYVAGGNGTPGSPTFVDPKELIKRVDNGVGMMTDIQWRYQSLYGGAPMPISPSQLVAEADAQKLDPKTYAEKRFSFSQREQELSATRQRDHEAKIAADSAAARDAEWKTKMDAKEAEFAAKEKQRAEQGGNNPDVRVPQGSAKYAEIKRAVEVGERPDPLKMTDAQRRAATKQAIHNEINAREGAMA